ncbi:MAG: aminotransferase class V-fold PLP-dependent enzyme, partial [Eubacterium sp.]
MIYLDNSATSYPKPMSVVKQANSAMRFYSFNSGRGGYTESLKAADKIYSVREKIADMFGFMPENIVFTKNCTEALNMAIKGSVKKGDHIIISSLEHNSVSRVVQKLYLDNTVDYDIANYSFDEDETVNNFRRLIRRNTRLIVCMHSSNVFGVSFPIARIGKICRENNIRFIVDGAQGAGVADINADRDNIDILCAPGHKCLYGPMGTGFMAIREGINLETIIEGGTGSKSLSYTQPDFTPDRFEAGTLNNLGIIPLGEGIDFINSKGLDNIYNHELRIADIIHKELSKIDGIKLYTPMPEKKKSMPIVSFNYKDYSSEKVAAFLGDHNICVRAGFHCSPLAHKHFKTIDTGTVRVSPGYFNTESECYKFINVVKKL